MRTPRVYPDTSVIGGCFDREFAVWSRALMDDFRAGRLLPVLSELLAAELERAPGPVRGIYADLRAVAEVPQALTPEVRELAERYAAHRIVPARFRNDLLHVALATIADADVVVSWNFRHIVRFDKIRMFNAVNLEAGYKPLAIHSRREVATYGTEGTESE